MSADQPKPHNLSPTEAWIALGRLIREEWEKKYGALPPALPRSEWPVRVFKRGEPRDDADD